MAVKMMKHVAMVALTLCGVFLLVVPAISFLLVLLTNYFKSDTKISRWL